MKTKTISKALDRKFSEWMSSIEDSRIKDILEKNAIITGGSIASMLLGEDVNDYDVYLRSFEAAVAVAEYYVNSFDPSGVNIVLKVEEGRIRITVPNGYRGETIGDINAAFADPEETYITHETEALAQTNEEGKPKYRPVFFSTNAITLSNKIQIVLRFSGEPDAIHDNYDFVHCTNYWTSWDRKVILRPDALESLLTKELRYIGSKYPVCSVIRLRKFIARKWTINAGQILKMLLQISELDLNDPKVLEDQLTGVDSAFFVQLIQSIKDTNPEKVNAAYLSAIIDKIF